MKTTIPFKTYSPHDDSNDAFSRDASTRGGVHSKHQIEDTDTYLRRGGGAERENIVPPKRPRRAL